MRKIWACIVFALALHGCGRVGFDSQDGVDAADVVDDANVYFDFSDAHSYVSDDWVEGAETRDNAPRDLFLLSPPFPFGLGVMAGRQLLEIHDGIVTVHDFRPPAPDGSMLPDHPTDVLQVIVGGASLVVTSSSPSQGDGVFRIGTDWTCSRVVYFNNVHYVDDDPNGWLEGAAGTFAGAQGNVIHAPTANIVYNSAVFEDIIRSIRVLPSGGLLAAIHHSPTNLWSVQRLETSPDSQVFLVPWGQAMIRFAEGELPPTPQLAWAVRNDSELVTIDDVGTFNIIASAEPGWTWTAALVPPLDHPLAGGQRRIYILESNRVLDIDRIIVIVP